MASLIPTRPTLHKEVEEEFSNIQLEMVHCSLCDSYHPPELHIARFDVFAADEPAAA